MPKYNDITKFKNYYKKLEHPYLIYIYFEAFLQKLEIIKLERNTNKISKHIPYQITIYLVSRVKNLFYNTNYIYN